MKRRKHSPIKPIPPMVLQAHRLQETLQYLNKHSLACVGAQIAGTPPRCRVQLAASPRNERLNGESVAVYQNANGRFRVFKKELSGVTLTWEQPIFEQHGA